MITFTLDLCWFVWASVSKRPPCQEQKEWSDQENKVKVGLCNLTAHPGNLEKNREPGPKKRKGSHHREEQYLGELVIRNLDRQENYLHS